jgi:hypothetical protein
MGYSHQGNTSSTIVISDNGNGTITSAKTNDAGTNCTTKSTVAGSNATLQSGQMCTVGGLSLTFTSGNGGIMGNMLVASRTYEFAGTLTFTSDGGTAQTLNVAGTGSSSDNCTKP